MHVIKQTKNFHGAQGAIYKRSLVGGDSPYGCSVFDTRGDARQWIHEADTNVYYQSHGEYGRPAYQVLPVSKVPKYLQDYLPK